MFKLAQRFHVLPHIIRSMPEDDFQRCLAFMAAEAAANELKDNQRKHYKK